MQNSMQAETAGFCTFKHTESRSVVKTVLSLYIAFVFVQSLFFKFSDAPETQFIFATLDGWAAGFGFPGLFNPGGIFSAKVIGSAELVASSLLLAAIVLKRVFLRVCGSALAVAIISGAIFFHLFTPLGVEIDGDGGLLFAMACGVWVAAVSMLWLDRGFIRKALF